MDSQKRQEYVYDYFGWTYPEVIHWGRIAIHEYGKFSTSEINKGINEGKYTGWDDPKLPTLRALKRRGIQAEAIRNQVLGLGLSLADITLSLENLYSENRKLIDASSNRYFFVEDPVDVTVKNPPCKTFRMPLHPGHKERGVREHVLKVEEGKAKIKISKTDACGLEKGMIVRLMGLCPVEVNDVGEKVVCEKTMEKPQGKLQWVQDGIICEILKPEGMSKGVCESNCRNLKQEDTIQFERYGFSKLEKINEDKLSFIYTHR